MKLKIRQTNVEGGTVYAVPYDLRKRRGTVRGWIRQTPDGWQPYGYPDPTPPRPTPEQAIDDLIELDSEEQRTESWPE